MKHFIRLHSQRSSLIVNSVSNVSYLPAAAAIDVLDVPPIRSPPAAAGNTPHQPRQHTRFASLARQCYVRRAWLKPFIEIVAHCSEF